MSNIYKVATPALTELLSRTALPTALQTLAALTEFPGDLGLRDYAKETIPAQVIVIKALQARGLATGYWDSLSAEALRSDIGLVAGELGVPLSGNMDHPEE